MAVRMQVVKGRGQRQRVSNATLEFFSKKRVEDLVFFSSGFHEFPYNQQLAAVYLVSLPDRMPGPSKFSGVNTKLLQCSKHPGDQITEFSLKYQRTMCLRCATAQHENFTDFVPISDCVDTKREEAHMLFDQIADLTKESQFFRKDRYKFLENIKHAEAHIKTTLKKVKAKLIQHIGVLETTLMNNLSRQVQSEKKSARGVLTEFRVLEEQLGNVREHVIKMLKQGTDVEVVEAVANATNNFNQLRGDVIYPEDMIAQKSLHFKLSPAIAEFLNSATYLGEVSLQSANTDEASTIATPELNFIETASPSIRDSHTESKLTNYSGTVAMSGTAMSHLTSNEIFHRENGGVTMRRPVASEMGYHFKAGDRGVGEAAVIFSAEHNGPCCLTGVVTLESGCVAVCDSKHKCIQLLNRRSEVLDDVAFHSKPCSIARSSDSSFAVSFAHKDFISLFNINKRRFCHVRDIRIGGKGGNYNLAFSRNKFAVCRKGEIRIIAIDDGSLLDKIPISTRSPHLVLSEAGSKIYMADTPGSKVVCMSNVGKVIWEFYRVHLQPTSLALDLNQLFIADASGRVYILSIYGDLVKEVACGGTLRAVSVDTASGALVLTQDSKDRVRSRTVKLLSV